MALLTRPEPLLLRFAAAGRKSFMRNISATSGVRFGVYRKKSNGSEPATYTWTISVASQYAAIAASYRNAVEIPDVVSSPFNTGSGLNPSSPDVTTTVNNTKVLRIFGADDNDASDPTAYPSAHTGRNTNTEGGSPGLAIGLADVSQATAGATGAAAWTLDASEEWGAVTIALAFADTTAPTPDPMTLATAPNDASTTSIDMTATTTSDPSTPVEYLFTFGACVSDGGTGGDSSLWQTTTSYTDTGLQVNQCYGYTVTARDSAPNTGTASSSSEAYTAAAVPGTPALGGATATTLDLTNAENGNPAANPTTTFAVQVVTTAPNDATWLNQWVDAAGNPSATEVWMDDTAWMS